MLVVYTFSDFIKQLLHSLCHEKAAGVCRCLKSILTQQYALKDTLDNLSRLFLMTGNSLLSFIIDNWIIFIHLDGTLMHRLCLEIFDKIECKEFFYDPKLLNRFIAQELEKDLGFPTQLISVTLDKYKDFQKNTPTIMTAMKSVNIKYKVGIFLMVRLCIPWT